MILKILKNSGKIDLPAKHGDAGFDIYASSEPRVIGSVYQGPFYTSISHIEYETDLKIEPSSSGVDYDFYALVYPRSSIIKTNLVLANSVGVIDSGYRGSIKLCFKYIIQPLDCKIVEGKHISGKKASGIVASVNPQRVYHEGDKIAQLIPCKHNKIDIEYVSDLMSSDRKDSGFGSTGS